MQCLKSTSKLCNVLKWSQLELPQRLQCKNCQKFESKILQLTFGWLVWSRYIHYWNWYKSGTISSSYPDFWSQYFKKCLKPEFEGLIKNVRGLNRKVLKIMYKTKIDVCSTPYITIASSQTIPKNILLPLGPLHAHQVTMFQWRKLS